MGLGLEVFELERRVVEVRFPHAYLHWDRAGQLWSKVARRWPTLKIVKGEPAQTAFTFDQRFEVFASLENARIIDQRPDKQGTLEKNADAFFGLVAETLDIPTFTRIGFRQMHFSEQKSVEAASKAVLETGLVRAPAPGKHFATEGRVTLPELVVRWEGETSGARVSLKAEGRTIELNPPLSLKEVQPLRKDQWGIELDVDYFTLMPVDVEQLVMADWLDSADKLVHRELREMFEGEWR